MYLTSSPSTYNNSVASPSRRWEVTAFHYKESTGWQTDSANTKWVKSFTISDYSTEGSNITMGCFAGSKITLNLVNMLKNAVNVFAEGRLFRLSLTLYRTAEEGARESYLESPCFIVDSIKIKSLVNGKVNATVIGYDLSYSMTRKYVPSSENATATQILSEIANKYNLTLGASVSEKITELDSSLLNMQFSTLSNYTDKETVAYLAGCFGCFARISYTETIEFEWYKAATSSIGKQSIFFGGASHSKNYTVNLIETGTKDNPIVYPDNASGHSINFENPYITPELVKLIYEKKIANGAISFRTGKVKYRGSPANMSGSIFKITDADNTTATFYVMKRTLNYDGGISETIECFGESETTINYKVMSPTQQKIDRLYSRMEEAIKNATDIITQTKGSIFEFIPVDENDPSKGNSGWKLYSTEFGNRNVILANSSGIGFSSNGGQSFDAAAIYIDENGQGHINGNYITAGSISADKIDTSQLVVGGNVDTSTLESLLNDVVDTANSNISSVDVLYAKNQSQTVAPPVSEFTTEPPVWEEGYFIWTLTKTVSGGVSNYSDPVCITGASGSTGVGISNVINYYLATNLSSNVTPDTSGWTVEVQSTTLTLKYLWNYEEVVYTNGTSQLTEPAIIGTYGRSISSRAEKYATSTSYNNVPNIDKDFSYNIPQLDPINKYLWNVEYTYYTDGSAGHTDPVVIGVYGDTGAEGATGADGQSVKDIEEQYYLSTSSTTQTGGSWSTAQPTWSSGKYIWTRSKITWENPTATTYTTPVLAKAINSANSTASSAQSAANTANTNASNALSVANTANGKVASWCHANNTTLIDGAKIYTGSITAMQIAAGSITADKLAAGSITTDKLNVGWNGNNCASYPSDSWLEHTNKSYLTISNGGTNYLPKITVSTSTYSTYAIIKSPYFFCPSGSTVLISFKSYVKTTSNSTRYMEVTLEKKGETAGKTFINTKSDSANKEVNHSTRYLVAESGYYCITFASFGNYVDSYLKDFEVYVANKGEAIVNGRISSVDKQTYFDLDAGEIVSTSSDGNFFARFDSGTLKYFYTNSYQLGGIEGWLAQGTVNNRRLMVYSPNIVEIGIGDTAENANGTGIALSNNSIEILSPVTSPLSFKTGSNTATLQINSYSSLQPCLQAKCRVYELLDSYTPSLRFSNGDTTAEIYMLNGVLYVADANGTRAIS